MLIMFFPGLSYCNWEEESLKLPPYILAYPLPYTLPELCLMFCNTLQYPQL